MSKIFQCFRNLKMSNQVVLFGFLIMTLVLLIILGTCLIQTSILFKAIQSSSQVITTKQELRSIQQTASRIQIYLERKYQQAINNILHIEKFFEITQQFKEFIPSCELFQACQTQATNNKKKQNIKYDTDHFCYQSLYNKDGITLPDTQQVKFFNKTVSMLNEFTLLFDVSNTTQLYIFDQPNLSMMISYPQSYQIKNYNIYTRPWYQFYENDSVINPNKSYYLSPVVLSTISNDLVVAVISTIVKSSPIGFAAQTLTLKDQHIQAVPINVILVDDAGNIILTSINSLNDATDQIKIYNSTYTGFNESDWEKIKAHSNNIDQPSNYCDGYQSTFCLYNQYFNHNVQVEVLKIVPENLTLIVFVNVTFSAQLDEQFKQLTYSLSKQIVQIEWILIIACLFMILVTVAMIQIIFQPLFKLMKAIQLHIRAIGNNLNKQIFMMTNGQKSNIFSQLSIKLLSLQDILGKSQIQKSDLCLKIENFRYNRKHGPMDLSKIRKTIEDIKEYDKQSPQNTAILKQQCKSFYDLSLYL